MTAASRHGPEGVVGRKERRDARAHVSARVPLAHRPANPACVRPAPADGAGGYCPVGTAHAGLRRPGKRARSRKLLRGSWKTAVVAAGYTPRVRSPAVL